MRFPHEVLGELGEPHPHHPAPAAFSAADAYTLRSALAALGGVHGLDTLDLACGHGHLTRLLARGGARRTVGVDSCEELIRTARGHDAPAGADGPADGAGHRPQNPADPPAAGGGRARIEYVVADAAVLPDLGPFHLATAVHLFGSVPDRTVLHAMFRSIRANLRPGGRLLAIVPNAGAFPRVDWSPYGVRILDRVRGGDAPLLKAHFLTEPPVPFEFREWAHADLAEAAVDAGFTTVGWQPNRTPPADPVRDEAYWRAYRAWPVGSLMTCTA